MENTRPCSDGDYIEGCSEEEGRRKKKKEKKMKLIKQEKTKNENKD